MERDKQDRRIDHRALDALPLAAKKDSLLARLFVTGRLLLAASAGSGKTTGLPVWAYLSGRLPGRIIVVVPRRVLAIQAALRMAHLLGSPIGQLVGYRVRGERRLSKTTRIQVITEGAFFRMLIKDPLLKGISMVMLDEAHLRTLFGDFSQALLRLAKERIPQLKVVVTSATISADFKRQLEVYWQSKLVECNVGGTDVDIRYVGQRSVSDQVRSIIQSGEFAPCTILAFLPGEAEIKAQQAELTGSFFSQVKVLLFYGAQDASQQKLIFEPEAGWRVILATDRAEMGLTPAADIVIDAGTVKVPSFNVVTGARRLFSEQCSRQASDHRAWRVGRRGKRGVCFRLWDEAQQERRPSERSAEIHRLPLEGVLLRLYNGESVRDLSTLALIEPPSAKQVEAADLLLIRLGAMRKDRSLTKIGRLMARMPSDIQPRLARIVLAGQRNGCIRYLLALVALQSADRAFLLERNPEWCRQTDASDFYPMLRALVAVRKFETQFRQQFAGRGFTERQINQIVKREVEAFCRQRSLVAQTYFQAMEMWRELAQIARRWQASPQGRVTLSMVAAAYAAGFPDRILVRKGASRWLTIYGQPVFLSHRSVVSTLVKDRPEIRWLLASQLEEKRDASHRFLVASQVTVLPERHLEYILADLIEYKRSNYRWSVKKSDVVCDEAWLVGGREIRVERRVSAPLDDSETSPILARAIVRGSFVVPGSEDSRANLTELRELSRRSAGVIPMLAPEQLVPLIIATIGDTDDVDAVDLNELPGRLKLPWATLSQLMNVPDLEVRVEEARSQYPDRLPLHGSEAAVTYGQDIEVTIAQNDIAILEKITVADRPAAWADRIVAIKAEPAGWAVTSHPWTKSGLNRWRRLLLSRHNFWHLHWQLTAPEDLLRQVTLVHPEGEQESFWMVADQNELHSDRQVAVQIAEGALRERLMATINQIAPSGLIIPEPTVSGGTLPPVQQKLLGVSPISGEAICAYAAVGLDDNLITFVARWHESEGEAQSALVDAQAYFLALCPKRQIQALAPDLALEVEALHATISDLYARYVSVAAVDRIDDEALEDELYHLRWTDLADQSDWLERAREITERLAPPK